MIIYENGSVGIGTATATNLGDIGSFKLAVVGNVGARQFRVTEKPFGWFDYVFEKNYELQPLDDVQAFVEQNHHLPDIPSQEDVDKDGIELGQMSALLLKKIEELYLYIFEQEKRIKELENLLNDD